MAPAKSTPDPLEEYLKALQIRDEQEQAQQDIINAYTKLADAYAGAQQARGVDPEPEQPETPAAPISRIPPSITGSHAPTPQRPDSDLPAQLRADLLAANRTVHDLNLQIASFKDEVETLKGKLGAHEKKAGQYNARIAKLEAERLSLHRRLRDKDGELKEKQRLVSSVQDENVGLEMQMNIAEERARKLEEENRELVERWMKRMGTEAEKMNEGSGWK